MMDPIVLSGIRGRVERGSTGIDARDLLAEVDRLHQGLTALADHFDQPGSVADGQVVAGALRQIVKGEA